MIQAQLDTTMLDEVDDDQFNMTIKSGCLACLMLTMTILLMMIACLCQVFEQVRVPSHARYC